MKRFSSPTAAVALMLAASGASTMAADTLPADTSNDAPPDASGQVQEIIVTAERREADVQRVPIAITTVTADTLANAGAVSLADLSTLAPSFQQANYFDSAGTINMFMRGEGTGDAGGVARDGGVGIYVDGFYLSRPQAVVFDFGDIERVEVLRGPQGTLYGRNVVGGAVNVISTAPSGQLEGRVQVDGGNYGYHRELVTIDTPTWNDVSAKITLLNSSFNGWTHNIAADRGLPGDNNFAVDRDTGGKLQVRWKPSQQFSADYEFTGGHLRSTGTYSLSENTFGFPTPGRSSLIGVPYPGTPLGTAVGPYVYGSGGFYNSYRPFYMPESSAVFLNNGLTLSYQVNSNLTLRSLTSYDYLNGNYYGSIGESFISIEFDPDNRYLDHEFTQELQAVGSAFNDRLKYVGGAFFFRESAFRDFQTDITDAFGVGLATIPGLGVARQQQQNQTTDYVGRSYAGYGQATWTPPILDDRLDLTVGLRYTKDKKDATVIYRNFLYFGPPGVYAARVFNVGGPCVSMSALCLPVTAGTPNSAALKSSNTSPAATASYRLTDDVNAYAKFAKGYKAGGISEAAGEGNFQTQGTFQPEKATSYELGLKSELLNHHVRLNIDAFHAEYQGLQQDFSTSLSNPNATAIFNVGKATVDGVEGDINVVPTRDLKINGTFAWMNSEVKARAPAGSLFDPAISGVYNPTTNPAGSVYQVGGDISSQFRLTFLPRWTASLNADWTFWRDASSSLSGYASYAWQAESFRAYNSGNGVINADYVEVPSYGLLDGRFTYDRDLPGSLRLSVSLWGKNLADRQYPAWITTQPGAGPQTPHTVLAVATYNLGTPRTFGGEVNLKF